MKNLLLWMSILLLCSCSRNYEKEYAQLLEKYEKEGKDVIVTSESKHLVVYLDSGGFWLNNLDEPVRKILSADKELVNIQYYLGFDKNGEPIIKSRSEKCRLSPLFFDKQKREEPPKMDDVLSCDKEEMLLIDDEALFFVYHWISNAPRSDFLVEFKQNLVCYFSNTDTLFSTNISFENMQWRTLMPEDAKSYDFDANYGRLDQVYGYVGDCAENVFLATDNPFPYECEADLKEGGFFSRYFKLDSKGAIVSQDDKLYYSNEEYEHLWVRDFRVSSDFSSKERSQKSLMIIADSLKKKKEEIEVQKFQEMVANSMTLEQLNKEYSNTVKFSRDFIGKTFNLNCKLERIGEVNGFFEPDGYKYKVTSSSVSLLGEWISGYDLTGYTNDELFVNLSYPTAVLMKVTLVSGNGRRFEFRNCELLGN